MDKKIVCRTIIDELSLATCKAGTKLPRTEKHQSSEFFLNIDIDHYLLYVYKVSPIPIFRKKLEKVDF
jgi:hypothetical protein